MKVYCYPFRADAIVGAGSPRRLRILSRSSLPNTGICPNHSHQTKGTENAKNTISCDYNLRNPDCPVACPRIIVHCTDGPMGLD